MGRAFPQWALRQIRSSGWHIQEQSGFLPLHAMPGDKPIPADDVQSMIDAGVASPMHMGECYGVRATDFAGSIAKAREEYGRRSR
jgi:hypothetical protein